MGTLILDEGTRSVVEPTWSRRGRQHDEWDPEWIVERFQAQLRCSASQCGECVSIAGDVDTVEDPDWEKQTMEYAKIYLPKMLCPAPHIFQISEQCAASVAEKLKTAFGLYWSDPASCANKLRVAVELLLTDQKIPKTMTNSRGKRVAVTLHQRIERFKIKNAEAANYLLAIKWLGNAGSHSNVEPPSDDDLLGAFELIEHVIEKLYDKREDRLKKIAKGINSRKGKPIKRRSAVW